MIEDIRNRHRVTKKCRYVVKGDDVLLTVDKREKTTASGLVYQLDASREANANEEATIIQKGALAFKYLPEEERYKVGDRVAITRYSGKVLGVSPEGLDYVCIIDTGIHAEIVDDE